MAKAQAASRKGPNIVVRFVRETIAELRKVSWPSRDDATRLTIIVLVVLILTSASLGLLDFLFTRLFAFIIGLA